MHSSNKRRNNSGNLLPFFMRAYGFAERGNEFKVVPGAQLISSMFLPFTMLDGPEANEPWIPLESSCNLVTLK